MHLGESRIMKHLIETATIPGIGEIVLQGLIVVVGPNSSGKTQLLHDLSSRMLGERDYVVCSGVGIRKPLDAQSFIRELEQNKLVIVRRDKGNSPYVLIRTSHLGTNKPLENKEFPAELIVNILKEWDNKGHKKHFATMFGPLLCANLFLGDRFNITTETKAFDHTQVGPQNEIQALHVNSKAQDLLNEEIGRAFGRGIGLDYSRHVLTLRVTEDRSAKSPTMRPDEAMDHFPIDTEGDGLRSYVAICLSMLVSFRPLYLIDEPESCLHPPQAYSLGQFIGKHANDNQATTVVATHSSHVLRGMIETADSIAIIRMSRFNKRFLAHRVPNDVLRKAIERPIVRADEILDGIFADGVIIVEADGDRAVYQAAYETEDRDRHFDATFIAVGGIGGIGPIAAFFHALRIPTAVMADLDIVVQKKSDLEAILTQLSDDKDAVANIIARCVAVREKLKELPPSISVQDAKASLQEIVERDLKWEDGGDKELVNSLKDLADRVDAIHKLKTGLESLDSHKDIQNEVKSIVAACKSLGLFLAPVGELERWMPELMTGVSRKRKAEWANEAVRRIRQQPENAKDVVAFVSEIASALEARRNAAFR